MEHKNKIQKRFVLNIKHDQISLINTLELITSDINKVLKTMFYYHGIEEPSLGITIETFLEDSKKFTMQFITNWHYQIVYTIVIVDNEETLQNIKRIIEQKLPIYGTEELLEATLKEMNNKKNIISLALSSDYSNVNQQTVSIIQQALQNDDISLKICGLDATGILVWEEFYETVEFLYKNDSNQKIKEKAQEILTSYKGTDWVMVDLPSINQINSYNEQKLKNILENLKKEKKYKQAIHLIELYQASNAKEYWLTELGMLYIQTGEIKKAQDLFNKVLEFNPNYAEAYFARGNSFLYANPEQAIKDFTEALHIKPDYWNALLNQGIAYFNNLDYEEALDCFDKLIHQHPHDNAYYCRGNVFSVLSDYEKAKNDYSIALQLVEKEPSGDVPISYIYNNIGLLFFNQKKYEESLTYFDLAIRSDNYAMAYSNKANALSALERNEEAEENYEASVNISDGKSAKIMFEYGKFLLRVKNYDMAFVYFENVLELQPFNEEAQMLRDFADEKINEEFLDFE
jgi:tetratricopeptide (TPR) repeat protein